MSRFLCTSKVVRSTLSHRNAVRNSLTIGSRCLNPCSLDHFRCSGRIAGTDDSMIQSAFQSHKDFEVVPRNSCSNSVVQRRHFLGVGDEGNQNVLSKVYEERRVLGYSPEQLFDVVAAVDLYDGFVPWCQRSEILRKHPDGSFDAGLEIGFKFLVENYISHVELNRPKSIKTTASESNLFEHLINIWEFNPGPVPGSCSLYFLVDFKFRSPLYRQVASVFFNEVASKLVGSFTEHCQLVYGPGIRIHERSYGGRS